MSDTLRSVFSNPWARAALLVLGVGLALGLLIRLQAVLSFLLLALLIALLLDPIVNWFENRGLRRSWGIAITLTGLVLLGALGWWLSFPVFLSEFVRLSQNIPRYQQLLIETFSPLQERLGLDIPGIVSDWLTRLRTDHQFAADVFSAFWSPFAKLVQRGFSGILEVLVNLLNLMLVPVIAIYWLSYGIEDISTKLVSYLPAERRSFWHERIIEIHDLLGGYLRGQLLASLLLAAMYIVGFFALSTPLALFMGLFAGIANIIPYLGVFIGLAPALTLSFLEHGDLWHPLGILLIFMVAQVLYGNVLAPRIIGDRIGLHPVTVLIAILVGGTLFGVLGLLLAVPVSAVIGLFVREYLEGQQRRSKRSNSPN